MSDKDGKPSPASKRVLIVSYYWPPSGGGGVQRWMKFAKLLPEEGWTPIVATPSNPDHPVTDASLNQEVDDVETWRFPIWEPSRTLRAWGVGGQMRLGAERRGQDHHRAPDATAAGRPFQRVCHDTPSIQ